MDRFYGWAEILSKPLSIEAIQSISDLLARYEYEPDENGIPIEKLPDLPKVSPLVLLDALTQREGPKEEEFQDTIAWKADILEAATLVAAGVINLDEEEIREYFPLVSEVDVWFLLMFTDLNKFWNRRGMRLTADDIREKWERGERIIPSKEALANMLRRSRGGT